MIAPTIPIHHPIHAGMESGTKTRAVACSRWATARVMRWTDKPDPEGAINQTPTKREKLIDGENGVFFDAAGCGHHDQVVYLMTQQRFPNRGFIGDETLRRFGLISAYN